LSAKDSARILFHMWLSRSAREQHALVLERVGRLEREVETLRSRLKLEPRVVRDIGTVDVADWNVKVSATPRQLESWRHYWSRERVSSLADLDAEIWVEFDHMGRAEMAANLRDADEDEIDFWTDDLLSGALPRDHPCWRVTVGRGAVAPLSYASTAPHVIWRYARDDLGDPVSYADASDERVTYGHFDCCIADPDSPLEYYFRGCASGPITSFQRSELWLLTRVVPTDCRCAATEGSG
jgi:hypothetical protein